LPARADDGRGARGRRDVLRERSPALNDPLNHRFPRESRNRGRGAPFSPANVIFALGAPARPIARAIIARPRGVRRRRGDVVRALRIARTPSRGVARSSMHRSSMTRIFIAAIITASDAPASRQRRVRNFFACGCALADRGVARIAPRRRNARLRANPHEFETFCDVMRRTGEQCARWMMLRRAAVAM
jgi:hypothetical protein